MDINTHHIKTTRQVSFDENNYPQLVGSNTRDLRIDDSEREDHEDYVPEDIQPQAIHNLPVPILIPEPVELIRNANTNQPKAQDIPNNQQLQLPIPISSNTNIPTITQSSPQTTNRSEDSPKTPEPSLIQFSQDSPPVSSNDIQIITKEHTQQTATPLTASSPKPTSNHSKTPKPCRIHQKH